MEHLLARDGNGIGAASSGPVAASPSCTPEEQGMDSARLAQMVDFLQVGDRNLHSVLVLRNGWVVAEAYSHPYTAATPHSLYSCTKSVISLLIGIALTRGVLTGISQPVADFFPWLSAPGQDPRKGRITIDHLLQMSAGLDWRESNIAYSSKRNTLMQMMRSQDWTRFVLERPPVADPGQRFDYSSGLSHVLSAILQAASGQSTLQFAQEHLLSPLGIGESVYWAADPAGVTTGGWGLQLTTRELARIGRLCGQQGRWQDQEIVAPGWIKRSTQARRQVVDGSSLTYRIWSLARRLQRRPAPKVSRIGYGQHWWIPSFGGYAARGRGGQALFILPNADLVVACTGGLTRRDVLLPEKLVADFILPAVVANRPLPAAPQSAASL
ncbi:MAG: serine hydrolase domain-containing protein, partial [Anaerolineae bacterium]